MVASRRDNLRALLLGVTLTLTADVSLAQIGKLVSNVWDTTRVERAYRVRSEQYHHDLAPNQEAIGLWGIRKYPVYTNSLGFKDRSVLQVPLRAEGPRVLLLGDSFTEGIGVAFEQSYAGILADRLRADGIDVLNAAVASYSPAIYYRKTRHLLEDRRLTFDEVVVFLDISDIHDEAAFYAFDDRDRVVSVSREPEHLISAGTGRGSDLGMLLQNNSVLARGIWMISRMLTEEQPAYGACRRMDDAAVRAMTNLERSLWTIRPEVFERYGRRGLELAQANMERLYRLLRKAGKRLTVVVYPWPDQIMYGDRESRQVVAWREWARTHEVQFISLFPVFTESEEPRRVLERYFIPCDMHLNEAGHRVFADAFLRQWRLPSVREAAMTAKD